MCNDLEQADLPTPDGYFVYCSPLTTTGGAENENQGYGCLRIAWDLILSAGDICSRNDNWVWLA